VAPSREEIEQRLAAVATGSRRRPVLVLGIDGASVPMRPDSARGRRPGQGRHRATRPRWQGAWCDAKGCRFSLMDGERLVPLRSWHQGHNARERGEALTQVKEAGVIPEDQVRLCVVADGAPWIWKHVKALCAHARHILDSSHCADDVPNVAKAHDGTSWQALEWAEATMTRRYLGQVSAVLGGLRRMQARSAEAEKGIAHCWDDLDAHREHTNDRKCRRGGSPLGSGGIESSNKCICHVRLKRSGAWWYAVNSNQMLARRCAKYNGTLDQVFVRYKHRLRETSE